MNERVMRLSRLQRKTEMTTLRNRELISQRNDSSNEWKREVCKDKWMNELKKTRQSDKRREKMITIKMI